MLNNFFRAESLLCHLNPFLLPFVECMRLYEKERESEKEREREDDIANEKE